MSEVDVNRFVMPDQQTSCAPTGTACAGFAMQSEANVTPVKHKLDLWSRDLMSISAKYRGSFSVRSLKPRPHHANSTEPRLDFDASAI